MVTSVQVSNQGGILTPVLTPVTTQPNTESVLVTPQLIEGANVVYTTPCTTATLTSKPQPPRPRRPRPPGMGKTLHYLDQMRAEVVETERLLKSLQTESKVLVRGDCRSYSIRNPC